MEIMNRSFFETLSPYLAVFSLSLLAAFIAGMAILLILHTKLVSFFVDHPDHRKVHSTPTPRIGGIAMVLAMLVTAMIWHMFAPWFDIPRLLPELHYSVCAAAVGIGLFIGLLDDSKFIYIGVRYKLSTVIVLAIITVFIFGVHPGAISVFNWFTIPEPAGKVLAVLWILGLVNAYNLVDGLDGFAGTLSALSLLGIAAVSFFAGCAVTAALCMFAVGAVAGFMVYNAPPAKVFMGDTGSCFLGYIVAILTLRVAFLMESAQAGKALVILPLLVGVPVLEITITVLRRYFSANSNGKGNARRTLRHIVTADRLHLHHRYLLRGFSHLETCILAGTLMATIVGGAICAAFAPIQYLPAIVAYLVIPVLIPLHKLGVGKQIKQSLRDDANSCDTDAEGAPESAESTLCQNANFFRKDLITQSALAIPVFILLTYLFWNFR